MILLALWNCISIPYYVAFGNKVTFDDNLALNIVERIIDVCFAIDIILNFRTTYINSKTNTEVVSPK